MKTNDFMKADDSIDKNCNYNSVSMNLISGGVSSSASMQVDGPCMFAFPDTPNVVVAVVVVA